MTLKSIPSEDWNVLRNLFISLKFSYVNNKMENNLSFYFRINWVVKKKDENYSEQRFLFIKKSPVSNDLPSYANWKKGV